MPSPDERRAAFTAVQAQVKAIVPDWLESNITDEHIWTISDSALWAAEASRLQEEVRAKKEAHDKSLADKDKT